MEDEIKSFINYIFDIDQKIEYHFHELYGFTFVIKEELSIIHGQLSSALMEPVGIIYEENGDYYFAPLCGIGNFDEVIKEYVKNCF